MSTYSGSTSIHGIGGYLHLRANNDINKKRIASSLNASNNVRKQIYLKEILVKKFFAKYGLNDIGKPGSHAFRT